MTTLVVGASGATGRLLVAQLLHRDENVKAIVRSPEKFPPSLTTSDRLTLIGASILDLSDEEMRQAVSGCRAVASCLGHNLTIKGIYGHPRKLVTDATRRLCQAIQSHQGADPTKYVLMNTAGNRNRDLDEPISMAQTIVLGLLRLLLPPQGDNEGAAEYLRTAIGQHDERIEWVIVRPDSLINEQQVTAYKVHASPTRSAIFDPGTTSRSNVAHFMADLITDADIWREWKGQMPVIYNQV